MFFYIITFALLQGAAHSYTCTTNRFPLTIGDSTGASVVTAAVATGSGFVIGGHSASSAIVYSTATQSIFLGRISGVDVAWLKSMFADTNAPTSGKATQLIQLELIGSNVYALATGTASTAIYLAIVTSIDAIKNLIS